MNGIEELEIELYIEKIKTEDMFFYEDVPDIYADNKDIVMAILTYKNAHYINQMSKVIKSDKAIIKYCVNQDEMLLEYATPELRNDKEFVSELIEINGEVLSYASDRVMNDINLINKAMQNGMDYKSIRLNKMLPEDQIIDLDLLLDRIGKTDENVKNVIQLYLNEIEKNKKDMEVKFTPKKEIKSKSLKL